MLITLPDTLKDASNTEVIEETREQRKNKMSLKKINYKGAFLIRDQMQNQNGCY